MSQEIQISILCHQPYFVAMETIITEMSKTLDLFEFPFAIEKKVSKSAELKMIW